MKTLNENLKDILYLVSNILEENNNRNYGHRDQYLHKLHNSWNDFIDFHPNSLDPLELIQKDLIKVINFENNQLIKSNNLNIDILDHMNKKPWEYATHKPMYGRTVYMLFNNIWYYFDFNSKCWLTSSIITKYLVKQLSTNYINDSKTYLKKYLKD